MKSKFWRKKNNEEHPDGKVKVDGRPILSDVRIHSEHGEWKSQDRELLPFVLPDSLGHKV